MSVWHARNDLAAQIAESLMKGREDSHPASTALADAIQELIEQVVAANKDDER